MTRFKGFLTWGWRASKPTTWASLLGAVATSTLALLLSWLLQPTFGKGTGILAIAISCTAVCALLFGLWSAVLATLLMAIGLWQLFSPTLTIDLPPVTATLQVIAYLITAGFIIAVARSRQIALHRADEANAQLQLAIASRDRVLAVVSHDLKDPVNAILLNSELLQQVRADDEATVKQVGAAIKATALRMAFLIRDLVDLGQIDSGAFRLHPSPQPIEDILRQALTVVRPQAEAKGIALRVRMATGLPQAEIDRERLWHVIANLVGNAIKFTPAGGSVDVEVSAGRPAEIQVCVRDSGSGIDEEVFSHLFDRAWMAHHVKQHGTGLGISIAKTVVEAHGGRIWAQNNADAGATFCFTIPAVQGTDQGSIAA